MNLITDTYQKYSKPFVKYFRVNNGELVMVVRGGGFFIKLQTVMGLLIFGS